MNPLMLLLLAPVLYYLNKKNSTKNPDSYLSAEIVEKANNIAAKYAVDKKVVKAIIMVESAGDSSAVGDYGTAIGLMQLRKIALDDVNQKYGTGFQLNDMYDVDDNIEAGTLFYKLQYSRAKSNRNLAIRSYNAGFKGASEKNQGQDYLKKVKKWV